MKRMLFSIILFYTSWKLQAINPDSEDKESTNISSENTDSYMPVKLTSDFYQPNWGGLHEGFEEIDPLSDELSPPERFSRTAKPSSCSISRSTLTDIKESLNRIQSRTPCELDDNNGSKGCKEFLAFATCGVLISSQWLKNQASQNIQPTKSFLNLEDALNKIAKEWDRNLGPMRQELGPSRLSTVNKLQENVIRIKSLAGKATKQSKIASSNLVVSNIGSGKIGIAIEHFKEIEVDDILSGIFQQTFKNYGGTNSVEKIISFIKKLQSCQHVQESYSALLKIMQDNRNADSPKFLKINQAMKSSSCPLTKLQLDFDKATQNAIKLFATHRAKAIRTGDDMAIINSAQNDWKEFRFSETNIIKEAYAGNHKNAPRVLLFISNLPKKEDQAYAYPVLFEEMVRTNQFNGHEILVLAYRANQLANGVLNIPVAVKDKLKGIRSKLPSAISALLFDSYIYMTPNTNTNHRLGMVRGYGNPSLGLEDPDIIACPSSTSNLYYKWNVEKLNNGRYFRFVNSQFRKSFGSVSAKCITVTKGTLGQHEWDVIPTRNGTLFWIRNRANGRLLEAGPNPYYPVPSSLKRLTCEFPWGRSWWKQTNDNSNKQLWQIS